jgi:RNA polymerase sigma factor (TIGR02999 family)
MTAGVTQLLEAFRQGDRQAFDEVFQLLYEQLRRIAGRRLRGERAAHTLSPTALVNEAYLELLDFARVGYQDRGHFLAAAAQVMRHILVDHAVRRSAAKRGGGRPAGSLDEAAAVAGDEEQVLEELLDLDAALRRLRQLDERQALVVECRFFAGLSIDETAAAVGTSPASVKREWTLARAWLNRELSR